MKIPTEIKTKNKIRDFAIIKMYIRESMTLKDIGLRFGISAPRVNQILYRNSHLISWDTNREKATRMNILKRLLENHKNKIGKKSTLDIVSELRKEIEGDKPLIDQSSHLHLTNNISLEEFRKLPVQDKIKDILNRK